MVASNFQLLAFSPVETRVSYPTVLTKLPEPCFRLQTTNQLWKILCDKSGMEGRAGSRVMTPEKPRGRGGGMQDWAAELTTHSQLPHRLT
jgi:hypothetical protein